jgi:hypothetical protein
MTLSRRSFLLSSAAIAVVAAAPALARAVAPAEEGLHLDFVNMTINGRSATPEDFQKIIGGRLVFDDRGLLVRQGPALTLSRRATNAELAAWTAPF